MADLYPWGGEFETGEVNSPIAVVTLARQMDLPGDKVAIWGKMKTENLGVEKVCANVISNPNIRRLIVFGTEIRGHRAGQSLLALWENGVDSNNRVIGAKGAMPYIENLDAGAIERFRSQVRVVDMIDVTDGKKLLSRIDELYAEGLEPYPRKPYIAVRTVKEAGSFDLGEGLVALHKDIIMDSYFEIREKEGEEDV